MKPRSSGQHAQVPRRANRNAFTLVELLAVLFTTCLVFTLLLTTVAASKPNTAATLCMNNHRRLVLAWRMYAQENGENLICNRDGPYTGRSSADAAWVGGWLDYGTGTDNPNVSLLVDHFQWPYGAYLGPYVHSSYVFKCPADRSAVDIAGVQMPRVRSISMSCFVGHKSRAWTSPSRYSVYTKVPQIQAPSRVFVLLDEHPASINDGCFFSNPDVR